MIWIFITVPASLLVIAMVVTPLISTILAHERAQRPLAYERRFRANLALIKSKPEVLEMFRAIPEAYEDELPRAA